MKVPLSWLNEFVDAGTDPAAVARALIGAGVGVESVAGEVLDLEVTANRPDLLSIRGVARELAPLGRARKPDPPVEIKESGAPGGVPIEVKDAVFCPRYIGRVVRGVSTGPSPAWMKSRLEAAGVRPVNVVADVTNYVMLECGQPLHAFDLAKLGGGRIVVRRAAAGEKMTAIDGREYTLNPADGVIADTARPVAIAGVMGGRDSETGSATQDVLLESAAFDPASVRRTSRRLGLRSESSYRFERGTDWETVEWASRRAARLLAELAGGKPAPGAVDAAGPAPVARKIVLRTARVARVLGLELPAARIRTILEGLGGAVEKAGQAEIAVIVPSARRDLKEEVDLIEEIARIEGYDKIPVDLDIPVRVAKPHPTDAARDEIRLALVGSGAFEVVTSSFEDATAPGRLPIRNPDGHVDRTLRNSLEPALRAVLRTNEGSKEPLRPIFEIARTYRRCEPGDPHVDPDLSTDRAPFDERPVVGIAAPAGAVEARGLVERVMERLQIPCEVRDGRVLAGTHEAGTITAVPGAAVAELDFAVLAALARPVRKTRPYSPHPAVTRDISMIFEERVQWADVEACVRAEAGPLLAAVGLFDVFRDKKVGAGRKSLAFSLRFLAPDRTLTGTEIDAIVERVRAALKSKLGGSDR